MFATMHVHPTMIRLGFHKMETHVKSKIDYVPNHAKTV